MLLRSQSPSIQRSILRSLLSRGSLSDDAKAYLRGVTPYHFFDFISNRALWAGVDVGAISNVPNLTGTLDLSSEGHLVDGAENVLVITSPGVSYPLTLWVEFKRTVDAGAVEGLLATDSGADTNQALVYVSATDIFRAFLTNGGVTQADVPAGAGTVINTVYKGAARFDTNSVNAARDGTAGTQDTSATLPATPTNIRLGGRASGARLTGYIRRAAIIQGAQNDAVLQAMTT